MEFYLENEFGNHVQGKQRQEKQGQLYHPRGDKTVHLTSSSFLTCRLQLNSLVATVDGTVVPAFPGVVCPGHDFQIHSQGKIPSTAFHQCFLPVDFICCLF